MGKQKKAYTVLEIGWEYNDEYYSTGNYGETYEAPQEIFLDKEKAKAEWLKKEIDAYRGQSLGHYMQDSDIEDYLSGVSKEELHKYFKDVLGVELDDDEYEYEVPVKATDEQIEGLIKLMSIRFYKLHETTITE